MGISPATSKGREVQAKADKLYFQRKWKKALDSYQKAAQLMPENVRLLQRIGDVLRRLKRNDEAVAQFKMLASRYASDGFWAKAIAINKLILQIDPSDIEVQQKLAETYSAQNQERKGSQAVMESFSPDQRQAISISSAEPRTMEQGPEAIDPSLVGDAISIAGEEPRTLEEPPVPPEASDPIELNPDDEIRQEKEALGSPVHQLAGIPLFSELQPNEVFAILDRLTIRPYAAFSLICEEGDIGRSMYIIADGEVEVFTKQLDGSRLVLSLLRGGDFFGEFGLLTTGQRNASVQAKTDVEALEITAEDFDVIAAKYPRIWTVMDSYLKQRMIDTILAKSDVFGALTVSERHELTQLMTVRKISAQEVVMEEGTEGQEMYFVKAGRLSVGLRRGSGFVSVNEIKPGDYLGEVAMLTGKPRTASIQARTDGELFCLTRANAAKVFKRNPEILKRLKAKMDRRKKETADISRSYEEARSTLEMV